MIIGDSGTGKSRSILNLNPKETFIVNVLNKPLPFKGSIEKYSTENKNTVSTTSYKEVLSILKGIDTTAPRIKNLVIDDAEFIMTTELFNRANENGYDRFTEIGLHMQQILSYSKNVRDDLNLAFLFHEDDVFSNKIKISKKVKTIGMMLEDKYNPISVVSVALFTAVSFSDKQVTPTYNFVTNRVMIEGIVIPAKSPEGMFDDLYIPNDLDFVFRKIREYYHSGLTGLKQETVLVNSDATNATNNLAKKRATIV